MPPMPKPKPKPTPSKQPLPKKKSPMKTFSYTALRKETGAIPGTDYDSAIKQYISINRAKSTGKKIPANGYGVTPALVSKVRQANIRLNKKSQQTVSMKKMHEKMESPKMKMMERKMGKYS